MFINLSTIVLSFYILVYNEQYICQEGEEAAENTEEISEVVDYLDTNSILSTHKPMVTVKTETLSPVSSFNFIWPFQN